MPLTLRLLFILKKHYFNKIIKRAKIIRILSKNKMQGVLRADMIQCLMTESEFLIQGLLRHAR